MLLILLVIAKIRHLQDYQLRLSYNMMPCPSGLDIANCLKYFSQVLLSKLETLQYNRIRYFIIISNYTNYNYGMINIYYYILDPTPFNLCNLIS